MKIKLHRSFEKQYKTLRISEKKKFKERRDIFLRDEFDPVLNNHLLKGKYLGLRSINITSDLRALYQKEADTVVFMTIDTHSNLYG